ncbi:helix-turn-helix transcriptional regulator [Acerihabitans sp. TG2]|uniref:helix-turn-helix transcriptional regulator n=1 Tax=Acerihabitans sp. TG2 TaxID=3096008 RepID=UPI002B2245E5|nr:helix-turn-helix transcriptional regulator [Acerihabitans sp. TG2]MEA9390054.1 helix-turn-helix transcriptional regulator [Acerihabitans sp. TG2]
MRFSINIGMEFHAKTFDSIISHMKQSGEFWYIKDLEHRFIYMTDYAKYYSGLPKGYNPEGKLDSECPAHWSEIEDVIQANDKKVMERQQAIPTLMTFISGDKEKKINPFMAEVIPLIENGKSIGVVGRAKKMQIFSMYYVDNNVRHAKSPVDYPVNLFTDREFDVIFYVMQSLRNDDISRLLNISLEKVNERLQSIFNKTHTNTLGQVVEFCKDLGYDKYAPYEYINHRSYIPLIN